MNPYLQKLREISARLTSGQKIQLGLAFAATLGLVWGFTLYANKIRYGVLFSNLDRADAAPLIAALKDRQISYRMAAGGTIIEVPFEKIDELRLELAGEGIPSGGGVGFELFDKPAFGLSDFVQNVNYRRALERELGRTIQSLDVVNTARVHLALPPESVFADEQREPSASVLLRLRSGSALPSNRVAAITHLVASGVEGLDPTHVSVIDGNGRMLSSGSEEEQMLSASQLEAKQALERRIERTLISILEPFVGPGRARARATVELNMTRVERIEESYDPAGAVVRSEQKTKSKNQGGAAAGGGVPGTASNLGGTPPGATAATGDRQESQSTVTNFEINKTVATIQEPAGMLARQSVAVVVDHSTEDATDSDGNVVATPTPRSAEEMQKITDLVRAAIGIDDARGDQLMVQNIAFDDTPIEESGGAFSFDLVLKILRYASLPLAVLLLALMVIRPAIAALRSLKAEQPETGAAGPLTVGQLQAQMQAQLTSGGASGGLEAGGSSLRRKLTEAVAEDPRAAALVLRSWIERRAEKS